MAKSSRKDASDVTLPWYRTTFVLAMAGGVLLWTAFPPLGLWPMAFVAPVFWLKLIRAPVLPGRRPYMCIFLAGTVHWGLVFAGIRLSHWIAAVAGWPVLSIYLACYPLAFIVLSRVAVHRMRVPLLLAAPLITNTDFDIGISCL